VNEVTGTFRWTPARDQAAVWMLTLTERTTGETGTLEVGVVDNWQAAGNAPIADPAKYPEEYGLPVFHLFYPGELTAGGYYRQLLHGPLAKQAVLRLIDGYAQELDAAARRSEARWGAQYLTFERWSDRTDFTTWSEEVEYIRRWVDQRWDLLERRLP